MNALLKTACLAVYALALAGLAGLLPPGISGTVQNIALVLLVIHALEKAILSKKVTYDFARLMDGATQVSCSGFGQVMIDQM